MQPHWLYPTRLLCPWDSPGRNTGVGSHSHLQGIFPAQGSNPGILLCRQILYHLSHHRSPVCLLCIWVYSHAHTCLYTHAFEYACVHMLMVIYTCIHICIHTYTHTQTYIYTPGDSNIVSQGWEPLHRPLIPKFDCTFRILFSTIPNLRPHPKPVGSQAQSRVVDWTQTSVIFEGP